MGHRISKRIPEFQLYTPPVVIDPVNAGRQQPGSTKILDITGCVLDRVTGVNITGTSPTTTTVSILNQGFSSLSLEILFDQSEQTYTVELIYPEGVVTFTLESFFSNWVDLRLGGDTLTIGQATGNDIRHRSGMTVQRDTSGMFFTGLNPWASWVKVESLQWQRGQNLTCEWIFTSPESFMMVGIGSTATDEANNSQFGQAEVQTYFNSGTNQWGLFGNNGNIGSTGFINFNTSISTNRVYKVKFEGDGSVGQQYTLFELPSTSDSDWDDESNVLVTRTIGGTLNPNELNIMPFIIPRNGGSQRFLAVKVQ